MKLRLNSEAETRALATKLAPLLKAGDIVALEGDLGAGKTAFTRAVINALAEGVGEEPQEVPSPTFTLVQTYEFEDFDIWHFDLYRLERSEEVWELGWEEALDEGVSFIEWPVKAGTLIPEERLTIRLTNVDEQTRDVEFIAGRDWQKRIENVL